LIESSKLNILFV